jgi:SAM-dependent methyltransferase
MASDLVGGVTDTRTSDRKTDPVCEFYTRHPYPPPVENLDRARDEWQDVNRHRADYHLIWPDARYRADLDILIAGSGPWQAAKYAVCRPAARVFAVDVSTTSLEHTEQLKRKYNLTNLELRQLPIEDVGALDSRFDLAVCTGVLHHLADPDAGLGALRAVLKTNGAMHLMVYARYGRAGIAMLQEYCRTLGIGPSDGDIDDLIAALEALPSRHPAAALLGQARDLRDRHALADALLNPRERSYSVHELFDVIARHGLVFGRWDLQAPYLPQ